MPSTLERCGDGLITGEEYMRMVDIGPCELVDGRIVPMSQPRGEHGRVEGLVYLTLALAVRAAGIDGRLFVGETGVYTRRRPDTVRGMDVAFMSSARAGRLANPDGYFDVAPELIVEIKSPDDSWRTLEAKATEYHAAGAIVVLLVDPATRTVRVCRSSASGERLTVGDTFEAPDVLPGVGVPIRSFFEDTTPVSPSRNLS